MSLQPSLIYSDKKIGFKALQNCSDQQNPSLCPSVFTQQFGQNDFIKMSQEHPGISQLFI